MACSSWTPWGKFVKGRKDEYLGGRKLHGSSVLGVSGVGELKDMGIIKHFEDTSEVEALKGEVEALKRHNTRLANDVARLSAVSSYRTYVDGEFSAACNRADGAEFALADSEAEKVKLKTALQDLVGVLERELDSYLRGDHTLAHGLQVMSAIKAAKALLAK
jgi:hypothetical protein